MSRQKRPPLAINASLAQDNVPAEVLSKLYVGSIHAAFNQEIMIALGITHVLNASGLPATFPKHFTYLSIDIRDKEYANILSCIPAANIFIESGMDKGGVLVHCAGGRSRSAAFISAFLMSSRGLSYDQALGILKSCRPVVSINRGFEKQLRAYFMTSFDVYTAHQVLLRQRIRSLHRLRSDAIPSPGSPSSPVNYKSGAESYDNSSDGDEVEVESNSSNSSESAFASTRRSHISPRQTHTSRVSPHVMPVKKLVTRRESCMIEARAPPLRLSRPGSSSIRVIPPLRGLERVYICASCGVNLFTLANVVRLDLDLSAFLDPLPRENSPAVSHPYIPNSNPNIYDMGPPAACPTPRNRKPRSLAVSTQTCKGVEESAIGCAHVDDSVSFKSFSKEGEFKEHVAPSQSKIESISPADDKRVYVRECDDKPVSPRYVNPPMTSRASKMAPFTFDQPTPISSGISIVPSTPRGTASKTRHSFQNMAPASLALSALTSPPYHGQSRLLADLAANQAAMVLETSRTLTDDSGDDDEVTLEVPSCKGAYTPPVSPPIHHLIPPPKMDRPQSAEKRRWLERMRLLKECDDAKIGLMAQADDDAVRLGSVEQRYMYLEHLEWMADTSRVVQEDAGGINCYCCRVNIGEWSWRAITHGREDDMQTPLFRIDKSKVCETTIALDTTPSNTPRLEETSPSLSTEVDIEDDDIPMQLG